MRLNRDSLIADIALLMFLVLCMLCVAFTASDPQAYIKHLIFLNIAFLCVIVTYFTTVTAGLVLNVLFIFGYGLFIVYEAVSQGVGIGPQAYFWMVMTPLLTVAVWLFTGKIRNLQTENDELHKKQARLATLDENTDLRNSISFAKDFEVFAAVSVRYHIPLTLLVMKVKYWSEIRRLVPEEQLAGAINDISKLSQTSIRTNDTLYMLDKHDATWGLLLFTDQDGVKVVMERIRQRLAELNGSGFSARYKVELSLRMGALEYDESEVDSPLGFIAMAKKQLEYDV